MISMGQAARQLRVSKSTLSKAISTGKLSANRREDGSWAIDPAELQRYWDANGHRARISEHVDGVESDRPSTDTKTDELVSELRAVIADLRRGQDDLRQD